MVGCKLGKPAASKHSLATLNLPYAIAPRPSTSSRWYSAEPFSGGLHNHTGIIACRHPMYTICTMLSSNVDAGSLATRVSTLFSRWEEGGGVVILWIIDRSLVFSHERLQRSRPLASGSSTCGTVGSAQMGSTARCREREGEISHAASNQGAECCCIHCCAVEDLQHPLHFISCPPLATCK